MESLPRDEMCQGTIDTIYDLDCHPTIVTRYYDMFHLLWHVKAIETGCRGSRMRPESTSMVSYTAMVRVRSWVRRSLSEPSLPRKHPPTSRRAARSPWRGQCLSARSTVASWAGHFAVLCSNRCSTACTGSPSLCWWTSFELACLGIPSPCSGL